MSIVDSRPSKSIIIATEQLDRVKPHPRGQDMDFLAFIQRIFLDLKQWLSRLPDKRQAHKLCFLQPDALLLGIFMFTFRFPSLRDFCLSARTDEFLINLGDCFKIQGVPCAIRLNPPTQFGWNPPGRFGTIPPDQFGWMAPCLCSQFKHVATLSWLSAQFSGPYS